MTTSASTSAERQRKLRDIGTRYALVIFLLLMLVLFSMITGGTFLTAGNFSSMIRSQAILLILALAVTLPLRIGEFDLSVAQVMVFSAIVVGVLTTTLGMPVPIAIVAAIAVGAIIGVLNGTLVVYVGLNAFVTTLGMLTLLNGLGYALTGYQVILGLPESLQDLSRHQYFALPQTAYAGWALLLVLWYVYDFTPLGRHLLAIGDSPQIARLAGIQVKRTRFAAFVAASIISAIAGVLLAGELGAVDPTIGPQYLLTPYAAAFLGTTTIQPGRFNALGTAVGLYLLVVVITGLQLLGAPTWVSEVFNGAALIAAILFARVTRGAEQA